MRKLLLGVIGLYLVAMGYLYFTQNDQLFPAKLIEKEAKVSGENIESLSLYVKENVILDGVLRKDQESDAGLILYFGGNADDATRFVLHVKELHGYDIVTFNYRGYVGSTGEPSEEALFEDALKIYDTYAKGRKVVVIGRSLGTGVATYLASKRVVDGLVLLTPYDSILSLAKLKYPFFPIDLLLKNKFESINYLPFVKAKIAVVEVENDATIPRYHFEKFVEAMPRKPLHVILANTTHGKILEHPAFTSELQTILGKIIE
ncbi:alpha/beta hydrolase [Sulfurospirillum arsenophilum]|uniref:alpha/beta hydrolase n=1 Tax=Sulfurospirillum arsenophilum TaxID=56698 RepID=UPI0005A98C9D|nr:alpha/beta fold hydrolase [Sulfurospirillum arsenophilum]